MTFGRPLGYAAALVGTLVTAACKDLNVPDYNNPSLEDLLTNPTRTKLAAAAQGLLVGTRAGYGAPNGYVSLLGILGRESYNFDAADPRFVTEMLEGQLNGGSPAFGGNLWGNPYANIRNAHVLMQAAEDAASLTTAEREAIRGFAKTIQALDFLNIINTRDTYGAPIAVNQPATADPAPIATKAEVFAYIVALLDSARTHLQAGGAAFPFSLSSGFAGFDTPSTFLQFNRALKARVDVYMGNYSAALTSLGGSFLSTSAPLTLGVYHTYSTGSGDATNGIFDPTAADILAHPSISTDAQLRADLTKDLRFQQKVVTLADPRTVRGITTQLAFNIYPTNVTPIPIIRNEELILLRAEANLGLNTPAGDAAALTDINFIRTTSGGLQPILAASWNTMSNTQQLDELLYNKRYSLLFEGGHRWIDMRRYNRLTQLPLDLPAHRRNDKFPFPLDECNARDPKPAQGC
ncbi:MAG TPA: RagB/SusD family nutrient uptake outer membrane protein [Gemmatimonadales bacterium]|nr:RagB/SusD family nutrient uptake outer membrane protein [Gemmatimonadales bacterium]